MKKFLSCVIPAVILLLVLLLTLGAYAYMLARPISYGMSYHHETVYDGVAFEGDMVYSPDGTVYITNSTYTEGIEEYYYYKDGYLFTLLAQNDMEYDEEVAYIEENFDEAVAMPFYASKINAFQQVFEGPDGYTNIYTCQGAITFAIVGGIIELVLFLAFLVLAILSVIFLVRSKKAKSEN